MNKKIKERNTDIIFVRTTREMKMKIAELAFSNNQSSAGYTRELIRRHLKEVQNENN